jgi:hypothetical protein
MFEMKIEGTPLRKGTIDTVSAPHVLYTFEVWGISVRGYGAGIVRKH